MEDKIQNEIKKLNDMLTKEIGEPEKVAVRFAINILEDLLKD